MDFATQTSSLMSMWNETQKQMMSNWLAMISPGGAAFPGGLMAGGGRFPGFDPSQMMKQMVDTWSGLAGSTPERLAGNVLGTPDVMMRSVNLLMKAWQVAAPNIEAGKPWKPDLAKLLSTWQQEMMQLPSRQMSTANEFADLVKTMFTQGSPITGPWMAMMSQALAGGHPGAAFMSGSGMMNQLMGFEEGLMPIMGGLGELPRGTVVREKMGKILKAADALTDLRKAQAVYHKTMGDALATAVERTIEHLAKLAEKGEKIHSIRDLMRTFYTVADKTLNEVFIGENFLKVQEEMTAALMTFKVRQREALEIMYQAMELPTRSEIDEAYKDMHELKREIRMLKRQLKEVTDKKPARVAAAPKAAKAPAQGPAPGPATAG